MLDVHVENGYEEIYVPYLVNKNSLLGRIPKITIRTATLKAVTSIGTISVTNKTTILKSRIKEIITLKFSKKNIFVLFHTNLI